MAAYDPGQWHDFATSFAAAAGALLGLAFVAISFNLDTILKFKALPGRAVETLAFFAYALAASLLIQLPGLSNVALGIGEAILSAGIAGLAIRGAPRWRQERGDPLSWRLTHLGPAVLIALLAVVGAVATMTTSLGGLYWLAAAMTVATAFRDRQQLGLARRDQALTHAARSAMPGGRIAQGRRYPWESEGNRPSPWPAVEGEPACGRSSRTMILTS